MKETKTIAKAANFTATDFGKLSDIKDYVTVLSPEVRIPGKVFGGHSVGATGAEFSFQSFAPGQETGFLHTHKNRGKRRKSSPGRSPQHPQQWMRTARCALRAVPWRHIHGRGCRRRCHSGRQSGVEIAVKGVQETLRPFSCAALQAA